MTPSMKKGYGRRTIQVDAEVRCSCGVDLQVCAPGIRPGFETPPLRSDSFANGETHEGARRGEVAEDRPEGHRLAGLSDGFERAGEVGPGSHVGGPLEHAEAGRSNLGAAKFGHEFATEVLADIDGVGILVLRVGGLNAVS